MLGVALVAQIAIVALGPSAAATCAPIELTVAARVAGAVPPRITLPVTGTIQLLRASVSSRLERDGAGNPSAISEGSFVVTTSVPGRLALPPFSASVPGARAQAEVAPIEVHRGDESAPQVLVRAHLDLGRDRATDSVFVGQQIDYVVDVQLNDAARQRLRRNPTFFPPDMPSVLAYDLPAPSPVVRNGLHCFETLTYRRALFPLFPGVASIPPAVLTYALPVSTSFFSREESYELRTDSVRFLAIDPPDAGRPSDYLGAVGRVTSSAHLAARMARMGDPILLTLRLESPGNVKLLPRPTLSLPWASIALGDERVTVDSAGARVRGAKEFDWLLTPHRAGRLVVPPIRYPYFDPDRAAYDASVTDSLRLDVATATLASTDTATTAPFSIRTTLRDEAPFNLPTRPWYWALLLLAPAPASVRRFMARRRRAASRLSATRRLRVLAAARRAPDARDVRRAYLDALRERVPGIAGAAVHTPLERTLRRAGVTDATASAAATLLERLDAAAFSAARNVAPALVEQAVAVVIAVNAESVPPAGAPIAARAIVLVTLLAASAHLGAMPEGVSRAFSTGVQAYRQGEFAAAQRLFGRASARAPRAVDAWANFGTAAWARGDSAGAAMGWQRALRLDPLDAELRERLRVIQSPVVTSPAYVPPVSVDAAALAALLLWIAAWLVLAVPAATRIANARAVAGGGLLLAVVMLGAALELNDRAAVRGLGVLRSARTLVDAPTGSAAPVAAVSAGEVGALGAREGAWVRISIDGARAGWLPVAAVLPLDGSAGMD